MHLRAKQFSIVEIAMRTNAEQFFNAEQSLHELDELKFAFDAIVEMCTEPGTFEREMASNARKGVRSRIDYLHDSFCKVLKRCE